LRARARAAGRARAGPSATGARAWTRNRSPSCVPPTTDRRWRRSRLRVLRGACTLRPSSCARFFCSSPIRFWRCLRPLPARCPLQPLAGGARALWAVRALFLLGPHSVLVVLEAAAGEVPPATSRGWCSCALGSARAFRLVLLRATAADLDPCPLPHPPFPLPAHCSWRRPPHRRPPPGSWSAVSGDSGGRVAFRRGAPAPSASVPCVAVVAGRAGRRLPPPAAAAKYLEGAIHPIAVAGSRLIGDCPRFFPRCPVRAAATSVVAGCGHCSPPARTAGGRLIHYKRAAAAALCDRHDPHETRGQDRVAQKPAEASTPTRGAVGGGGRPPP